MEQRTPTFTQQTSLIRLLRWGVLLIASFFIVEFIAFYVSSQTYLKGLTRVSGGNALYDLTTQANDSLNTQAITLRKAINGLAPSEAQPIYEAIEAQTGDMLEKALGLTNEMPQLRAILLEAKDSLEQVNANAHRIFEGLRTPSYVRGQLSRDSMIVSQFELEARESLRRAQIEVKRGSDEAFSKVYRGRYVPLLFAISVAIGLCILALAGGQYVIASIERSIENLNRATDAVADGNLDYQAEIRSLDEIGRLTHEFNLMVTRLKQVQDRLTFLAGSSSVLSGALDLQKILQNLAELSVSYFADWCMIDILQDGDKMLRIAGTHADPAKLADFKELQTRYRPSEDADNAVARVLKTGRPEIVTHFPEDWLDRASTDPRHRELLVSVGVESYMCIPLTAGGRILGSMSFVSSNPERRYSEADVAVALEIGRRAGLAMDNILLFDAERRARRAADEGVQIRDEFLSIASHELKTPITSLKLQMQMTQRALDPKRSAVPPTPEKLAKSFDTSARQIERLVSLVDDLLDVSRIQAGKLAFTFEEVDLSETVEEVLERFQPEFASKKVQITSDIEPATKVVCDRFRIDQVIVNLISNALKYGAGKPVHVLVHQRGPFAEIHVRDQGIGIALDNQEKVFGRFERAISPSNISGLGLGLYIARQIVEAHQGFIRVESRLGVGSEFIVQLPIAGPVETNEKEKARA